MTGLAELEQWISDHRALAITAAAVVVLAVVSLVGAQLWAAYRGRSLTTRASVLFAVVQAGVAYVTITGVYEFWAHKVKVPTWDAIGIAVIIEAVTWAAVADIYVHGATDKSVGTGRSGPLFWMSVVGGGIMAVAGSPGFAIALGRAVVVALGAAMWHVRIRQKTRPATQQSRWTITPRQLMLRWGWMIPDDTDVRHTSREWQVRILTRSVGRAAGGNQLTKWRAERLIRRVMESGDAGMVREAQGRYALQHVLRTEITPTSTSMMLAIEAAREALNPATPAPEPEPVKEPEPPRELPDVPKVRPRPVPARRRTAAATAARADRESVSALKARAVREATEALRAGEQPTGAAWGGRFGLGEQWGRDRLAEARRRIAEEDADPERVAAMNGAAT